MDFGSAFDAVNSVLAGTQGAIVSLSALGVLLTFVLGQRASARERQRQEYAKALQAAVKWTEMPFRIRRRLRNDAETKLKLAGQLHDLHEEIAFHHAWLSVEAPRVATVYQTMCDKIRAQTRNHLIDAWDADVSEDDSMNLRGIEYPVEYAVEREAYIREVHDHLLWFGVREKTIGRWRRARTYE
jgi:hypothetical protein